MGFLAVGGARAPPDPPLDPPLNRTNIPDATGSRSRYKYYKLYTAIMNHAYIRYSAFAAQKSLPVHTL